MFLCADEFIRQVNFLSLKSIPFFFIVDFEVDDFKLFYGDRLFSKEIYFNINDFKNYEECYQNKRSNKEIVFESKPISLTEYKKAFESVQKYEIDGHSYLVNLTFQTEISTNLSLFEIFLMSRSAFKLYVDDLFTCFSPEIFIKIRDGFIFAYPMKGTIDARMPNARKILKSDEKELAEHATIVDLIRNDLGMVADEIKVKRFRFFSKIKTIKGEIYQTSSEIRGYLGDDYKKRLGNIIVSLLPAGSISGAPKEATVKKIKEVETYKRGYYTGVGGYFDGSNLESYVLIRFIEKTENKLFFKSGGGITIYSDVNKEYKELIEKIYVPIY
ncbi:para-aminobenzoate synthetase component 1 [Thermodesulfobium acidiphilum]|uniref:Para-aminobenzoate synthetase component 1 n=2 Tax=Thermodesulfobium acidiphilum TaxID=1794699 RepID=A0A2R4VYV1_THEAF|nr:para-aminobenzoate synthetase component 1 [Thermodesulfobium acidiphilum]